MDPETREWLMNMVFAGTTTMKSVCSNISDYNDALPKAIAILKQQLLAQMKAQCLDDGSANESMNSCSNNELLAVTSKVGDKLRKFFPSCGRLDGVIHSISLQAPGQKCIYVNYADGNMEDMTQE
eukprot:1721262-Ditylum_brightwellii.AAC.1